MKGYKYSHAYTIAFEVETTNDAGNVTADELRQGLFKRLASFTSDQDWVAAADAPYDSMVIDEDRNQVGGRYSRIEDLLDDDEDEDE